MSENLKPIELTAYDMAGRILWVEHHETVELAHASARADAMCVSYDIHDTMKMCSETWDWKAYAGDGGESLKGDTWVKNAKKEN